MKRTAFVFAVAVGSVLGATIAHIILVLLPEGLRGSFEGILIAWAGAALAGVLVGLATPVGDQK